MITCPNCLTEFERPTRKGGVPRFCSTGCQQETAANNKARPLTADRLREIVSYDAESGHFIWLATTYFGRRHEGERAGWEDDLGYWHIRIDGRLYLAHRLAWLYTHSEWPTGVIDHEHGVADGDGLSNLRDTTQAKNCLNRGVAKNNRVGLKGVSMRRGNFRATIRANGKHMYLGDFTTGAEAYAAYIAAAIEFHGEFARF